LYLTPGDHYFHLLDPGPVWSPNLMDLVDEMGIVIEYFKFFSLILICTPSTQAYAEPMKLSFLI
jgi:hypothetical protein